jgi:hypothetical protein
VAMVMRMMMPWLGWSNCSRPISQSVFQLLSYPLSPDTQGERASDVPFPFSDFSSWCPGACARVERVTGRGGGMCARSLPAAPQLQP